MGLRATLKKVLQSSFNIPRWVDYTHWRHLNHALIQSFKSIFTASVSLEKDVSHHASFEEVVQQLKLTEKDLLSQQQELLYLTKGCLGLFILLVSYFVYLVLTKAWWGIMPTLVLAMMLLCQAFRYHFWRFQIQQRRLGCSLQEWFQATFIHNRVS